MLPLPLGEVGLSGPGEGAKLGVSHSARVLPSFFVTHPRAAAGVSQAAEGLLQLAGKVKGKVVLLANLRFIGCSKVLVAVSRLSRLRERSRSQPRVRVFELLHSAKQSRKVKG